MEQTQRHPNRINHTVAMHRCRQLILIPLRRKERKGKGMVGDIERTPARPEWEVGEGEQEKSISTN